MCRVYCDSCLYVDIFEGRKDRFRDLGDFALQIFRRVDRGEFKLVISDWLLFELRKHAEDKHVTALLKPLLDKGRVIKVFKTNEDVAKARAISPEHYDDALHAILAHKAEAIYLLTRNIPHYVGCEHLVEIKFPENV